MPQKQKIILLTKSKRLNLIIKPGSIVMYPACGIVFYVKIFYVFTIFNFTLYIFNCGLPRYGVRINKRCVILTFDLL